jgi:hypothetical protein
MMRIHRRDQLQIRVVGNRPAHRCSHPATRPKHPDPHSSQH